MAAAALFDSGYQAFCDVIDVLLIKVATLLPNLMKIDKQNMSKFMMIAAAILNSGYQAFFYIIYVLLFKVATFLPSLVEIGE